MSLYYQLLRDKEVNKDTGRIVVLYLYLHVAMAYTFMHLNDDIYHIIIVYMHYRLYAGVICNSTRIQINTHKQLFY